MTDQRNEMEAFLEWRFAERPHLTRPAGTPYDPDKTKAAIKYYRGRLEAQKRAEADADEEEDADEEGYLEGEEDDEGEEDGETEEENLHAAVGRRIAQLKKTQNQGNHASATPE